MSSFCFDHDGLFLIPAEELSEQGLAPAFSELLLARQCVSSAWIGLFERAFRLYWRRARELSTRAPRTWLPARAQNVCVALDPARVRPFFQPLGSSSCLVDRAAFEPRTSSLELAAYQFFHAERWGLLRRVVPAVTHDLAYWIVLTREERDDFRGGCRRATTGRTGWRALAEALEWIPEGFHERLKPPVGVVEPLFALPGTGVSLPARRREDLERLVRRWTEAAEERVSVFRAAQAPRTGSEPRELADWIAAAQPLVVITGGQGEVLWARGETLDRLQAALSGVTSAAARRLRADWTVIDARSRAFLDSLGRPDDLPPPGAAIDQDGLAYLHRERRLVAYNLDERGMERRSEPAPPFERWMLAARTIHEWGHLAVEAGWVRVPEQSRGKLESARAELAELLDAIVRDAPAPLRSQARAEVAALERRGGTAGGGLLALLSPRLSDWGANLLAQRYLLREESETYVRNNVRPLLGELDSSRPFQALAQHAFEFQYSTWTRPARSAWLSLTWIGERFLASRVLSESRLAALLDAMGRLCRLHEIDEACFRFGRSRSGAAP